MLHQPERDLADGVTSGQLDDLSGGRVLGVHLQGRQLQRGVGNLRVVANQTGVTLEAAEGMKKLKLLAQSNKPIQRETAKISFKLSLSDCNG